ncbi:MAG: hypothetical protein LBQ66_16875 [Planctomycetaceae bacterium]|jgi:rhodanese-related sulfurtransferase|nr:hypothetical protein [Planctomycetaceae bacterium]
MLCNSVVIMRFIFALAVLFLATPSFLFAEETMANAPLPDLKNVIVSGPYCGVYSLYACLYAMDKQPQIQDFLMPEYIGSFRGSTSEELIACAEKYGVYGKCYGNIAWHHLSGVNEPAILHFRGSGDSEFNHWVAFLGVEGNHVRIIDAPHELAYLTTAELLAQWDGTAIVLSEKPIKDEMIWMTRFEFIWVALTVVIGGVIYKSFYWTQSKEPSAALKQREFLKGLFIQTVSLCAVCGFVAIAYHAISPIGFLKNPSAVAEVTRRYYAVDVPEIPLEEMRQISEQKTAVIFDARYHRDFESGSIPGAISLPINSDLAERKHILRGVDKSQRIVLYCQSSGCGFSDDIASFLKFNGYRNVSIFRGGYREWEKNQNQP